MDELQPRDEIVSSKLTAQLYKKSHLVDDLDGHPRSSEITLYITPTSSL